MAFESVQSAYSLGREMICQLRDQLTRRTGEYYAITHVLMSGASVGSAQERRRYFGVFHRIPFGVDPPEPRPVGTTRAAIGELQGAELKWEFQHYPHEPSDYSASFRNPSGMFDAHAVTFKGARLESVAEVWPGWRSGENLVKSALRQGLRLPQLEGSWDEARGAYKGWAWPRKVHPDRPSWILHGQCCYNLIHWAECRHLTPRECSRLMGYPDLWYWPTMSVGQASAWIGKCCPVQSGRWISTWIRRALEGNPGAPGQEIGWAEALHNSTNDWKRWKVQSPTEDRVTENG